jgi:hypothetical protein
MTRMNALGETLSPAQDALASCYDSLLATLRTHRSDLAPFEERNALKALAALWQVMNGLDMDPGQLDDVGA